MSAPLRLCQPAADRPRRGRDCCAWKNRRRNAGPRRCKRRCGTSAERRSSPANHCVVFCNTR